MIKKYLQFSKINFVLLMCVTAFAANAQTVESSPEEVYEIPTNFAILTEEPIALPAHISISDTDVSVDISLNDNGHFVYDYTLVTSNKNVGKISSFEIDLSCESIEKGVKFDRALYPTAEADPIAEEGTYSLVVLNDKDDSASNYVINIDKKASWAIFQSPGETGYLQIISPFGPVSREYQLLPNWNSIYFEMEETILRAPMSVTGMIEAPGCKVVGSENIKIIKQQK